MKSSLQVRIDSLAFGGDGVGRHEGTVVFVPGTTPGDLVDVQIREKNRRFIRADIVQIVEAGADRVAAPCESYPACGGCQWQHVHYPAQFAAKRAIVERALQRFGNPEITHHPAPAPFDYRRRARLTFRADKELHAGFLARQSDQIVGLSNCMQLVPALDPVLPRLWQRLRAAGSGRGEIELLANHNEDIHIAVHSRTPSNSWLDAFMAPALEGFAGLIGTSGADTRTSGSATIDLDDRGLRASARSFTQANAAQDAVLRNIVVRTVQSINAQNVLEFHAGIGNFTFDLAKVGCSVTAVESEPLAVALLRDNLTGLDATCHRADAESFTWSDKPDCILLDPPREGAQRLCQRIADSKVRHVVYVSCDPMTLARDLESLTAARFKLRSVDIIDMMPQTYHIETACFLSRN